jgi:HAD superfamily hydrolase (TIGR01509 family)
MRFDAVLFDCDGVLVDSEPITNGVLRDILGEQGWALDAQTCVDLFVGHSVLDRAALIEQHTGQAVTAEWLATFRQRRDVALLRDLMAVPHIHAAVAAVHTAMQGRIACASGADFGKVVLQLTKVDLLQHFEGRILSGQDMPRNKPHPDIYLAAARLLAVPAPRCLVVEDTVNGALAGLAAGATVLGYDPQGDGAALRAVGVQHVISSMAQLPALVGGVR